MNDEDKFIKKSTDNYFKLMEHCQHNQEAKDRLLELRDFIQYLLDKEAKAKEEVLNELRKKIQKEIDYTPCCEHGHECKSNPLFGVIDCGILFNIIKSLSDTKENTKDE